MKYDFRSSNDYEKFKDFTNNLKKEFDEETNSLNMFTTSVIELILNKRSGGSLTTMTALENGLFFLLGGTSRSIYDHLFSHGYCCCYDTASLLLAKVIESNNKEMYQALASAAADESKRLVIMIDNYNKTKCRKRFKENKKFSNSILSISVIFKTVPFQKSRTAVSSPNITHSYSAKTESMLEGINLPWNASNWRDANVKGHSLQDFDIFPSLNVISSSQDEIFFQSFKNY